MSADTEDDGRLSSQPLGEDKGALTLIDDIASMLQSAGGRNVLMWLLGECGVYGLMFTGVDAATSLNLGKREIGIKIISKLNELSPVAYPRLLLDAARDKFTAEPAITILDEEPSNAE